MYSKIVCVFCLIAFASCYQINSTDDLRAVSVTNNPNIVPESAKIIPAANLMAK